MTFLDAFWHLVGFATIPVLLGLLAAVAAKLIWRRSLRDRSVLRLSVRAIGVCIGVAIAGLVVTGRDGSMVTYGAMVAACAVVLWWPLRRG